MKNLIKPTKITLVLIFLMININTYSQTPILPNAVVSTATKLPYEKRLNGFNLSFPVNRDCNSDDNYDRSPNTNTVLSTLDNNFLSFRFGFGTAANYYQRTKNFNIEAGGLKHYYYTCADPNDITYTPVNTTSLNTTYNSYAFFNSTGFENAKENVIYPYINSLTSGLQNSSIGSNFVVNILNHYRHYTFNSATYNVRTNLFADTALIKNITTIATFNSSAINSDFKAVVNDNLNTYKTLILNKVPVTKIELGNELTNYFVDNVHAPWLNPNLTFNNAFIGYDENNLFHIALSGSVQAGLPPVWYRAYGTTSDSVHLAFQNRSLRLYSLLCKMYIGLLKDVALQIKNEKNDAFYDDLYADMQFGIPITMNLDNIENDGFKSWTEYLIQNQSQIGYNAFIFHLYYGENPSGVSTPNTNSNIADLNNDFSIYKTNMRDVFFNEKVRKAFPNFIHSKIYSLNPAINNPKFWITEWNIHSDNGSDVKRKISNTLLHSMFYYDLLMSYLDINANQNLKTTTSGASLITPVRSRNSIVHGNAWAGYSNYSDNSPYALVRLQYGSTLDPTQIKYNSIYYAHLLLLPVLTDDNIKYVNVKNGGLTNVQDCDFRLFYKTSTGFCSNIKEYFLYFNNKNSGGYSVNLKSLLALPNTTNKICISASVNRLYADNLYASMGATTFRSSDVLTANPAITIQRENVNVPDVQNTIISKNSLGYIRVIVTTYSGTCTCDNSSSSRYSNMVPDNNNLLEDNTFKIYPNPVNSHDILNINYTCENKSKGIISVFDLTGKVVYKNEIDCEAGNNNYTLNMLGISNGFYMVKLQTPYLEKSAKLIIK